MSFPAQTTTKTPDLKEQLTQIGLVALGDGIDDFLARASKDRFSPRQVAEEIVRLELTEGAKRSLERRLERSRIGRFKTIADYDWNWPKKIERDVIERALTLPHPARRRAASPSCSRHGASRLPSDRGRIRCRRTGLARSSTSARTVEQPDREGVDWGLRQVRGCTGEFEIGPKPIAPPTLELIRVERGKYPSHKPVDYGCTLRVSTLPRLSAEDNPA